jgi:hypothetical protein
MTAAALEISVKPEIYLLEDLVDELAKGKLRVPRFQRPYVWRPEQMLDLFDSIERNYPIGSVLVWDTNEPLASLDQVGDIQVPLYARGPVSYLLDGHQRLSTLLGALRRPADAPRGPAQQDWMWWVYRELGSSSGISLNKFTHWKQDRLPPPHYIPLRAALRTMDFLAYARELENRSQGKLNVQGLIEEAEEFAQRFKSYKIAVVRLIGGDLSQAVKVFSRLNSKGQSMTPDQMVSALTYQQGQDQSLGQRIDLIQENISTTGFGNVNPGSIFRTILACAGEEDVLDARWDALAERVQGQLEKAVEDAENALHEAVDFFRGEIRLPLARLLPYNLQLLLLATFFWAADQPTPDQKSHLRGWFWATSWSGHFAGANTTQVKTALAEMKAFARGDVGVTLGGAHAVARPFPDKFDMRSARVRTFVIWDLQEWSSRLDTDGSPIDALDLLERADTNAYRHVVPSGAPVDDVSSPANRVMLPTRRGISVRRSLVNLSTALESAVCESHGIPASALQALRDGSETEFVRLRAAFLARRERDFIVTQGVALPDVLVGEADIDTEE